MPSQNRAVNRAGKVDSKPLLEWVASGLGLLITLALMGMLGWNAMQQDGRPPAVLVEAGSIDRYPGGYTVEIRATNAAESTAAGVQIEGVLRQGGEIIEIARARLDFVPGNSVRRGGLFFTNDPRRYDIQVRALGYARP